LFGQGFEDQADIYDNMVRLLEELRLWKDQPPEIAPVKTSDSIDIEAIFSSYDYHITQYEPGTTHLEAQLPPYLGLISSRVSFTLCWRQGSGLSVQFTPQVVTKEGWLIYDDSASVAIKGFTQLPLTLVNSLSYQLQLYRTLGLPPLFRPTSPLNASSVMLYFHGRDTDSLTYCSYNHWLATMYTLSEKMMVYAVPTSITHEGDILTMRFYLVLTTEEAYGNHFIIVDESYWAESDPLSRIGTTVHFYPFVRVDNLLSLYGSTK